MKNLALSRIQKMKPYSPPLAGRREFGGTLLDFNERTILPSSKVKTALQNFLNSDTLQQYPEYDALEEKLAKYSKVNENQIMITNGSDQAIDLVFRTFTQTGDKVIIPSPSFAMFSQSVQIMGNKIFTPLYDKESLSFPLRQILDLKNESVKLIVICNPNNPTGTSVPIDDIEKIVKSFPNTIILIDEAYFEFSQITAVPLIKKYANIVVARTFSKAFGLPSLRMGYIIADPIYINELLKVRGPYDINMFAYVASLAALDDVNTAKEYAKEIMSKAKPLVEDFFKKNKITFYSSGGNFLLYKPTQQQEEIILKKNGFLVRQQNKINIEDTLRLTIGTVKQMKKFIGVYKREILKRGKVKKYAFLDRDGTLIFEPQDTYQIDSIEKLQILEGVLKGLKKLQELNYVLIMVTNQDGLGTNSFPKENFDAPQNTMLKIFKDNGIVFQNIFICPHLPSKKCNCRKPKLGMLKNFLKENKLDKDNSFVCGDRETDNQFAKNLKVNIIQMQTNGDFHEAIEKGGII